MRRIVSGENRECTRRKKCRGACAKRLVFGSPLDTSAATTSIPGRRNLLEYTDAPTSEPAVAADAMTCPLCGHVLPKNAENCGRCDWVRTPDADTAEGKASD